VSQSVSPLDEELVARIERAFEHHSSSVGGTIGVDDLKKALGLQSDYLAWRVLAAFDTNGDGAISRDEFVAAVKKLVFGTDREKLAFAFKVHDHNGDGFLDREELHRMIALSLAESDVSRESQVPEDLVQRLLAATDRDHDGKLSLAELEAAVEKRPELLAQMTRSEAIWIAPNEDLLLNLEGAARSPGRLRRLLENRGLELLFLVLWVVANVAVVAWSMTYGRSFETSDPAMELGRALGACLDLNAALVFVPMMRRLLTWLRASFFGRVLPLDESVTFHKIVGHVLYALAWLHTGAFLVAYAWGHPAQGPLGMFKTERGISGGILLAVFAVMWIFALDFIRRGKRFEIFYFTHLLYFVWLVAAIAHAPRLVAFAGAPFLGFAIEQILRWRRRRPASQIAQVYPLRSAVTRIELPRPPGFTFQAGDFAFVRIPAIAKHEWHPFTISSAPEAPSITFHVRSLGNWTSTLRRLAEARTPNLEAYLDGPYGSPSAHIFRSRHAVFIAAGIGVTPFASVLACIEARERAGTPASLEKVYFFWLNRDQYSFEWFRGLLSRLEEQDTRRLFEFHLCMTGARTGATAFGLELARELMHAAGQSDIVTGLRTKTHLGHPNWEAILEPIGKRHERVDVFFCGPHGLAQKIERVCHRLGMSFREERF
jgi:predicted ferric reductase/Ca2+-binding EF-hand superfamily protein